MKKDSSRAKCSLALPRDIWRQSKIKAMDQGRDWQDLVAEALKQYLGQLERKAARKPRGKGAQ